MSMTSVYCIQGNHIVERDQMSWLKPVNGKGNRRMCSECKNALIDRRKKTVAKTNCPTTIKAMPA